MLLFTQQEIFSLFWNARDRPHAKDLFLLSKLGHLIRTTLTKTYLKLCIYHTNCISWAVTEDNMMLQCLGKINLSLNTGAIALSHTSPLKDTREHRCPKGFCSLQLLMDCLAHQPQTNPLLKVIKPTLPHKGLRVILKTQKHLRSQKNCAFLVMGEAEKVTWLMEDRDDQTLPVAVPGDGAFTKRKHIVICLCYMWT